jgi:MFS family permease
MDKFSNHIKNVLHGFFLAIGTTIAEPSTILPLIVNYFSGSSVLVGLYASLLRGGAVIVQMFAAFYAQSYPKMLKYLRIVFIFRFLAWFGIGVCIMLFGEDFPSLTLFLIGIFLFIFSFSAGFGAIYFREILAKIFTHKFRGYTTAYRQFFSAVGAIMSGAAAGFVLNRYEPPMSFGYLFIISAVLMGIGLLAFATVDEPEKTNISHKEKSFIKFLKNSFVILKNDPALGNQISTYLLSYSYLIALPFIILEAKERISLSGTVIGLLISVQMVGAALSNFLWGKLSASGKNRLIANISIFFLICVNIIASLAFNIYHYILLFFIVGAAVDGLRLAFGNLILIIAPEEKRPVYIALQANISSLGIFFSVLGGFILGVLGYSGLYIVTLLFLTISFLISLKLKDIQ